MVGWRGSGRLVSLGEEAFPGACGSTVLVCKGYCEAMAGGVACGAEGQGSGVEAGVALVGVCFAGAFSFAWGSASSLSLSGRVVPAFLDVTAGPDADAVDGRACLEVALGCVGADGAGRHTEHGGRLVVVEEVVGMFSGG